MHLCDMFEWRNITCNADVAWFCFSYWEFNSSHFSLRCCFILLVTFRIYRFSLLTPHSSHSLLTSHFSFKRCFILILTFSIHHFSLLEWEVLPSHSSSLLPFHFSLFTSQVRSTPFEYCIRCNTHFSLWILKSFHLRLHCNTLRSTLFVYCIRCNTHFLLWVLKFFFFRDSNMSHKNGTCHTGADDILTSSVRHGSFVCVPWLMHLCVPWLMHLCDMTRYCVACLEKKFTERALWK